MSLKNRDPCIHGPASVRPPEIPDQIAGDGVAFMDFVIVKVSTRHLSAFDIFSLVMTLTFDL